MWTPTFCHQCKKSFGVLWSTENKNVSLLIYRLMKNTVSFRETGQRYTARRHCFLLFFCTMFLRAWNARFLVKTRFGREFQCFKNFRVDSICIEMIPALTSERWRIQVEILPSGILSLSSQRGVDSGCTCCKTTVQSTKVQTPLSPLY
jgi:hypothetical protein